MDENQNNDNNNYQNSYYNNQNNNYANNPNPYNSNQNNSFQYNDSQNNVTQNNFSSQNNNNSNEYNTLQNSKLGFLKSAKVLLKQKRTPLITILFILLNIIIFFLVMIIFTNQFLKEDNNFMDFAIDKIYENIDDIAQSMATSEMYKKELYEQLETQLNPYCNNERQFNELLRQEENEINKALYVEYCTDNTVSENTLREYFIQNLNEIKENEDAKEQLDKELENMMSSEENPLSIDKEKISQIKSILNSLFYALLFFAIVIVIILILKLGFLLFIHEIIKKIFYILISVIVFSTILPLIVNVFLKDRFISIMGINFKLDMLTSIFSEMNTTTTTIVLILGTIFCYGILALIRYAILMLELKKNN